jgi:hypothetical protein
LYRAKSRMTWLWTRKWVGYGRMRFRPPPPRFFVVYMHNFDSTARKIWGCHYIDYERTFFWDVTPWSLANFYRHISETWWRTQQVFLKCRYISDYTASHFSLVLPVRLAWATLPISLCGRNNMQQYASKWLADSKRFGFFPSVSPSPPSLSPAPPSLSLWTLDSTI